MTRTTSNIRQKILLPTEIHDFDKDADCANTCEIPQINKPSKSDRRTLRKARALSLAIRMLGICKEIGIMLVVVITYAAFANDFRPPKVTKSPAAFPFFPRGSVVSDWYRGEISMAIEQARSSDIAFVMFYAPWDAESQVVRHEFELTARYMHERVYFAAVNCWHPGSECRMQNNKVYNWPVLIAYPTHGRGIQYNGPYTAPHMIQFLNSICKPLLRINNEDDVNVLLANYDAVAVGHVNALAGSLDYNVLYTTAIRFLERDPFQDVVFAVKTLPKDCDNCNENLTPYLQLHVWNETLIFNDVEEWKPDVLLNWIIKKIHQVTMWISPSGMKSQSLSLYIQPGPALILFTPRNPLLDNNDYYDMLHEVALEYNNCDNNKNITTLHSKLLHEGRIKRYVKHKTLLKNCLFEQKLKFPTVVTYAMPKKWLNNSCCLSKESCSTCSDFKDMENSLPEECKGNNKDCIKMFQSTLRKNTADGTCEQKHDNVLFKTSMLIGNDEKSPSNLQQIQKHDRCRLALISQKYSPAIFSDSIKTKTDTEFNISGLACKTNVSLTMIAMDSLKHYSFAEQLGVNILNVKDKTSVVIINDKMESHHILEQSLTDLSLKYFIYNFTNSILSRALNSLVQSKYVHKYSVLEDCFSKSKTQFCVQELNSDNFLTTILQPDKAVVVLYYSKQCSFCQGVSYKYLTTARSFRFVPNLQFTRIDGDQNSLPWEYTMENYPTILYFPVKRKSESRAFPRSIPITVQNLFSFILLNLNWNMKLQAMWSMCDQSKFESDRRLCISSLRSETLQLINDTLREWRKADIINRPKILRKIQKLRTLHLLLAHKSQNLNDINHQIKTMNLNLNRKNVTDVKNYFKDEL